MDVDRRLSSVLGEFARTLGTDFPIQAILDHLVIRIVDVLPISAAGVTLISTDGVAQYIAASDGEAMRFEQLQTDLGEGPCQAAHLTGRAVCIPDLTLDEQFAAFSPRGVEEGLAAVFAFPLGQGADRLGALDLYRSTPGPLDAEALAAAQTLADVTAAYMQNAKARADLQEAAESAHHVSLHDALTGLPNRTLLVQRLDHAIHRSLRSRKTMAVLFADLDEFKSINDTYGHHVGDELLTAVAGRLGGLLRAGDTLSRLAGDEFVILCEDLDDESMVEPLATRLDAAFAQPFELMGATLDVRASVGIAFASRGDETSEQVLQAADTAMYQVKRRGGAGHATLDQREQRRASRQSLLGRDLRGALGRDELHVVYQPIVATGTGQVTGVEALLRWAHPVHGNVAPSVVVPLAEESGLITEIGRWMLERACVDRKRWQRYDGLADFEISVNVSAVQLMTRGYARSVAEVLAATDTEPRLVTLEVTENVFVRDADRALVVLGELKRIGVMIALDDFGTGYSSLSYLKQFPVDTVKVDRVFVADLDQDPTSRLIVAAVVGLAHVLEMVVVAEGVESTEQYEQVASLGCDSCQGFYFARPMSANGLDTLLADGGRFDVSYGEVAADGDRYEHAVAGAKR